MINAQTLECGDTITADFTFTSDLDCTGHTGPILMVDADNITIDGAGHRITGSPESIGISISSRNNVTIINLHFSGMNTALSISSCEGIVLDGVVAETTGYGYGVKISGGTGNKVLNGTLTGTGGDAGIYLQGTDNSLVKDTTVTGFFSGVRIVDGSGNQVQGGQFSEVNRGYGISVAGGAGTVVEFTTITGFVNGVYLDYASGTRLTGLELSDVNNGYVFRNGSLVSTDFHSSSSGMNGSRFSNVEGYVLVLDNEVAYSLSGLNFTGASFNNIGGAVRLNSCEGIVLDTLVAGITGYKHGVRILGGTGNKVLNSALTGTGGDAGIYLQGTDNSLVKDTTVTGFFSGVRIVDGSGNQVQGGQFSEVNRGYGISVAGGAGTVVEFTTITGFVNGVYLDSASGTRLTGLELSDVNNGYVFRNGSLGSTDFHSSSSEMNGSTFSNVEGYVLILDNEVAYSLSGLNFTGASFNNIGGAVRLNSCEGIVLDTLVAGITGYKHGVRVLGGTGNKVLNSALTGTGGDAGIYLQGTDNSLVKDTTVTGFFSGVRIVDGSGNQVQGGQFSEVNGGYGISVAGGAGTVVEFTTITGFVNGVYLDSASGTRLTGLELSNVNNGYVFRNGSLGSTDFHSSSSGMNGSRFSNVVGYVLIFENEAANLLSGLNFTGASFNNIGGAVRLNSCEDIVLDTLVAETTGYGYGVRIWGGTGNEVLNSTLTGTGGDAGIYLQGTDNSLVKDTTVTGFFSGVRIVDGSGNQVQGGQFSEVNGGYGISVAVGAVGTVVEFTTIAEFSTGIYLDADTDNCLLRNNTIARCGTGIAIASGAMNVSMRNMIVYFNSVEINNFDAFESITFSDIRWSSVLPGEGNISADPMFRDLTNNDFHLNPGSPAIDAGDSNDPVPEGGGARIDMGALEFGNAVVFGGFRAPLVDNDDSGLADKAFKANRVIPIKFQLYRLDGSIVTDIDIAPPILELDYLGYDGSQVPDEVDTTSAGNANEGVLFRFDPVSSQWIFNLSTKNSAAGFYRILIKPNPDENLYPAEGLDPIFFVDENGEFIEPFIKLALIKE